MNLSNVREVISRNYNLIQCGFEIFTIDGKSYFFVLESEKELKNIIKKLVSYLITCSSNLTIKENNFVPLQNERVRVPTIKSRMD